jgi:Uma2 family endonuclease
MSTSIAAPPQLLTAEEFIQRYNEQPVELDKGLVVEAAMPSLQHGLVCANIARHLGNYVEERQLGRVMSNDSWIRTRRSPDSVRGPDVVYLSYERLPKGPLPAGLLECVPELIVEVRSTSDT